MDINRLTCQQPSCSKALCLSLLHVDTRGMAFRSYLHPRLLGIHGFRICRHWSQGWFEWNPWFAKALAQSGHFEKENRVWVVGAQWFGILLGMSNDVLKSWSYPFKRGIPKCSRNLWLKLPLANWDSFSTFSGLDYFIRIQLVKGFSAFCPIFYLSQWDFQWPSIMGNPYDKLLILFP